LQRLGVICIVLISIYSIYRKKIVRAIEDGQVGGIIPHLVEGGVSILQYAGGMILFMEHDFQNDVNMKLIVYLLSTSGA
jgi:hypothetical protein